MKRILVGLILAAAAFAVGAQNTNRAGTIFTSAVRAAAVTGQDMANDAYKCVTVVFDITAVPGVDTVTLTISGKDQTSGKYYTLLAGAAEAGAATKTYMVCPGITATANVAASAIVPAIWRVSIAHSAASNFTYSVGYSINY